MVPLDHKDILFLAHQRHELYMKLLDCSTRQLSLMADREGNDFPSLFEREAKEWNQITKEIEYIQEQMNLIDPEQSSASDSLLDLMQAIERQVEAIYHSLSESAADTGADLRSVKNQRKVMNAYYRLDQNDQVPLYFDHKK
ncbi:hypothetical protein PDUR_25230 [Paenibacillus durus]|uniref:Flagellar protein FliT n=1 Tax=Paenibacillus durus TaxID=44251 RepID=A0A089HVM5_PAEDU|nr:hypothetical protein PDUR_25230 [Paenibacillus durus]